MVVSPNSGFAAEGPFENCAKAFEAPLNTACSITLSISSDTSPGDCDPPPNLTSGLMFSIGDAPSPVLPVSPPPKDTILPPPFLALVFF